MKNRRSYLAIVFFVISLIFVVSLNLKVNAAEKTEYLSSENYEVNKGADYSFAADSKISSFGYGKSSIGSLFVKGSINSVTEYNGVKAFGTSANITFGYDYNDGYKTGVKTDWNLSSTGLFGAKTITIAGDEIKASKDINGGAIVIQKSADGSLWENVSSLSDAFNSKTTGRDVLYTTTEEELKLGTYYRVIVVYTMEKQTKAGGFMGFGEEYDKRTFAEVYKVFLCSDNDYSAAYDLTSRSQVSLPGSVEEGFYIQRNGSSASIKVKRDNGSVWYAGENATFTDPGKYTLTITTKLNKEYVRNITVNSGVKTKSVSPTTYDCGDNKGYKAENKITGTAECCFGPHFNLFIGHSSSKDVITSRYQGADAFGVQGNRAEIYAQLSDFGENWAGSYDSWGKKEKETVDGVVTGEVGTGALIIQKSKDGYEWEDVDAGKYAKGLHTTDFETHYGTNGKVLLYTPSGEDIISGMFYRILYAYEVKNGKTTKNYLEEYFIYLCNASTESVTFHNKTVKEALDKNLSEVDSSTAAIYKSAESMKSGSLTTTGFTIDKNNNKTAKISVKKNGTVISNEPKALTETGKYDITVTSMVGNSDTFTIYVDRDDEKSIYKRYFGDSFIDGVRVLGNSDYPIFEAGQRTKYHIEKVSEEYLPLYGTITNLDTKKEIMISGTRSEKSAAITEAGEYVAVFSTNPTFATDDKSGDNLVITIRFIVIEEGTAPGPVVNRQRLNDYARSSLSDAYPIYYGVTYKSASKGDITLAFATEKAAIDFAYAYETGDAEELEDGTFKYKGSYEDNEGEYQYEGSFVKQKENYADGWTLADAIYNYARQSVEKSYFDYGTLHSLNEDVIKAESNLRTLELDHNVVIFADASQKAALTDLNALPFISNKPYLYSVPKNGGTDTGSTDFEFTSDIYGADSYEVIITDVNGKKYKIEYNKSVGEQLEKANCPSGIVTIVETTKYGQASEPYEAVFIANGDNTGIIDLVYELDGKESKKEYSQDDCADTISCDGFWFESIKDELDPYGLVTISDEKGLVAFFATDSMPEEKWVLEGTYTVKYKNRLGYDYSFKIKVNENDNAIISFEGASSDELTTIVASYGDKNVKLPKVSRYGYDFDGYVDKDGIKYENEISSILFKGQMVLSTTWKPKSFVLTTVVNDKKDKYEILYGRQIDLPKPEIPEGYEFEGWLLNGEEYTDNTFVLTTEENVVLSASLKRLSVPSASVTSTEPKSEEQTVVEKEEKTSFGWIVVLIVILCAGAGVGTFWFFKVKGHNGEDNNSEV